MQPGLFNGSIGRLAKPRHAELLAPAVTLLFVVLTVFLPTLWAGFIWDDDGRITNNPYVLGVLNPIGIWTSKAADICPLTTTTFLLEHTLWGNRPWLYHFVNITLHAGNSILLWRLLTVLGIPGAWWGALLWALHPVQVETVAWVTEMKNTESAFFYLLALHLYVTHCALRIKAANTLEPGRYRWFLVFAAAAMASKSSTVILPIALLLLGWWMRLRLSRRLLLELLPVFLMAALPCLLTLWTQNVLHTPPEEVQWQRSIGQKFATAGDACWFYLAKLVWPSPLIFIYPRWKVDDNSAASYLGLVLLVLLLAVLWSLRQRGLFRGAFFTLAYFVIALLPVLGLVDGYFWRYSLVADHFQYLASMAPLAFLAAAVHHLASGVVRSRMVPLPLASLAILWSALSWHRSGVFHDQETLWNDTLAKNPAGWMAWNNLGLYLAQEGRTEQALSCFQQSIATRPKNAEAYNNLGNLLARSGRYPDALSAYHAAQSADPLYPQTYNNLGNVFFQQGNLHEAIVLYRRATELAPDNVEALTNLGLALSSMGDIPSARACYEQAIKLAPNYSLAHANLGLLLLQEGDLHGAQDELEEALKLDPLNVEARNSYANALAQAGARDRAVTEFRRVIQLAPAYAKAHLNLGLVLLEQHHLSEALGELRQGVELAPTAAEGHQDLAYGLTLAGRYEAAVAEFEEAYRLSPSEAAKANLARAQALVQKPNSSPR